MNTTEDIQAGSNDNSAAGSALDIGENDANIESDEDETMTEEASARNVPASAPQTSAVISWFLKDTVIYDWIKMQFML